MNRKESWTFKGIDYTLQDIKQAMIDLDDNKYDNFTTAEKGSDYNFLSPQNKLYGVKRIFECISKNKGGNISVNDFGSYNSLRNKVINAGYEMLQADSDKIKYYWVCQGKSYEEEKKLRVLKAPAENTYKRLKELKPNDIVINYSDQEIKSISIVKQNTVEIDSMFVSNVEYKELENPVPLKKLRELFNGIYEKFPQGPFQKTSINNLNLKCKQKGYLFPFPKEWFEMISPNFESIIIYKNFDDGVNNEDMNEPEQFLNCKNLILYGPPGTGKTYNTVVETMRVIAPELIQYYESNLKEKDENKKHKINEKIVNYEFLKDKFNTLKQQGQIEFVTFHQSYSYEEFVEGIKPVLDADNIKYEKKEGVFKRICEKAAAKTESNFDEVYQKFINDVRESEEQYCLETLIDKKKFAINLNSNNSLNLLVSENLEKQGTLTKEHLKNRSNWKSYSTAIYQHLKDKYELIETKLDEAKPHILIIDEINRGNISKIFGELITLIEEDKRLGEDNEVTVKLPYAEEGEPAFGVPSNLYIIGTMNTSDRSIASVDIALRRRFKFKEMMPQSNLVADFGVSFSKIFDDLNKKISILLDRDHQIGHSYFIKDKYENAGVKELKDIWFDSILPLLNEYFYGDWEKLNLVIPGFISSTKIPESLISACDDEYYYKFKTIEEFEDNNEFRLALTQEKPSENE